MQIHMALVDKIQQAARRSHQDIDAAAHRLDLTALGNAAGNHRMANRDELRIGANGIADLHRQLARRRQDQRTDAIAARRLLVLVQPLQQRQGEGSGLAGAGLGEPEQVTSFQQQGNRLRLDRGGMGIFLGRKGLEKRVGKAKPGKGNFGQNNISLCATKARPCPAKDMRPHP
jgi:hypothetical protein